MTRHLLRLIWNRKRANGLIMVEIFCSFLVLWAVALLVFQLANNYRQPLGYAIDNVWTVAIDTRERESEADVDGKRARRAKLEQILVTVRELREVESACAAFSGPYGNSSWGTGLTLHGRQVHYGVNPVTDGCPDVLRLRPSLLRGRWFSPQDQGSAWMPVVINQQLAREAFGDDDPVDRMFPVDENEGREPRPADAPPPERYKVVGVVQEFRQDGELSTPGPYMLRRIDLQDPKGHFPNNLFVRLRPGTTAAFEEPLVARLRALAPNWSFETRPLARSREDKLRQSLQPLTALAIVAGFLLLMVALGLTGVVWQNVTQRTREIGLRRAKGANIMNVRHQILAELALMTTLALLVALALLAQVPLLPLSSVFAGIPAYVAIAATVVAVAAMYLLTLGCAWYPSRLATRIPPAEALHYE